MIDRFRARRHRELGALLERPDVVKAIADFGTPLLFLDVDRVRMQYRRLADALPGVRMHYALKALADPVVIDALRDEGGCFDVASLDELDAVGSRGVIPRRVIYTHPIKTAAEIAGAYAKGVRTFVIDNAAELAKFVGCAPDVRILVRLSYPHPGAGSDLSSKFGVDAARAESLVREAVRQGVPVAGFSFHVGSQLDDPEPFRVAVATTLALMDTLEARLPVRFDTLDIGGGFPAAYEGRVTDLERIAEGIRPLLEARAADLDVIAEPGRIMVADAMTLVTSVVGIADRPDGRWYYLDDGLYGSYSNVLTEHMHPLTVSERELRGADPVGPATLAGPTCDSTDVIARGVLMPELEVGDLVLSPTMGAYTTVTACRFNGRALTRIISIHGTDARADRGATTVPVARVLALPDRASEDLNREPVPVRGAIIPT